MMPSWLWTLVLFLVVAPLHVLFIGPQLEDVADSTRFLVAIGYLALGFLWAVFGLRLGTVRR